MEEQTARASRSCRSRGSLSTCERDLRAILNGIYQGGEVSGLSALSGVGLVRAHMLKDNPVTHAVKLSIKM